MLPLIKKEIQRAPIRKAPGLDEVKSEMLTTDIELNSEIIMELWKACGRCGEAPMSWLKALFVPIHKKDRMDDPANHRPISLLSQVRKIVERAMDMLIREKKLVTRLPTRVSEMEEHRNSNTKSNRATAKRTELHRCTGH